MSKKENDFLLPAWKFGPMEIELFGGYLKSQIFDNNFGSVYAQHNTNLPKSWNCQQVVFFF